MADRRVKKERFLPYAYAKLGVELSVVAGRLDGRPLASPPNRDQHVLELGASWEHADLELQATVSPAVLAAVLPEEDRPDGWEWLLTLRCDTTRLRKGWRLPPSPAAPLQLRHTLRLETQDCAGSAELQLFVIRSRPAGRPVSGLAAAPGTRLAGSRPWELRIDRRPLPSGHHLDIRFRRFSEDPALEVYEHGLLHRLEADRTDPILWLNAEHPSIERVLSSDGTTGPQARLREVLFDLVSTPVWTQLFLRAAHDLVTTGEATYPWQESVLDALLVDMYPAQKTGAQRRDQLTQEHGDFGLVLARLDSALQRRLELAGHVDRLVEELLA